MVYRTKTDIAYTAGFFDGDGAAWRFPVHTRERIYVDIAQVEKSPLIWLQEKWGGRINSVKNRSSAYGKRELWKWNISGKGAVTFLTEVLPYLKVKRDYIGALLAGKVFTKKEWYVKLRS